MTTKQYIKCRGNTVEVIDGKIKIGFVRCPKCRSWAGIYKGELDNEGRTKRPLTCVKCKFSDKYVLEGWIDD
jgi:hypothetical protein